VNGDLLVQRVLGQFTAAPRLGAVMFRPHSHLHAPKTNAAETGCGSDPGRRVPPNRRDL
jgi:hypothetical protein